MSAKLKAAILIVVYLVIRFALDSIWQQLPFWASYLFELAYVVGGYFWLKMNWKVKFPFDVRTAFVFVIAFLCGFGIHEFSEFTELRLPIDFADPLFLLLILVVAPVLEELVFRGVLFDALFQIKNSFGFVMVLSAVFFSVGHAISLFSAPEEFHGFLVYQTTYVFFLGLACAGLRLWKNSILLPMLAHFLFNFGFVMGQFYF